MLRTLKIIGVNLLVFTGLVLLIEAGAQVMALIWPSYDVLFLQPEPVLGWTQVPNLHWTWAGHYWYAADFNVAIDTNALGFRDVSHEVTKAAGVKRVALLGDSFIEAAQVPLEKTAARLLEGRLNSHARDGEHSPQWEVLNFGISNYGVGQYLLTWERYASRYHPDYVAIFVAKLHMQRTISRYEYGAFRSTAQKGLWIRPTFDLDHGALIREQPRDFGEFVRLQSEEIQSEFAGQRSRKNRQWVTLYYLQHLRDLLEQKLAQPATPSDADRDAQATLLTINMKIIEELGRKVTDSGARFIVIDVSRYFHDEEGISDALRELSVANGFGYIPLSDDLLKANANGVSTRWAHDYHFNEAGNEILANDLYGWVAQHEHS